MKMPSSNHLICSMEACFLTVLLSAMATLSISGTLFCYHFLWKPKALEKQLRKQGIGGTSYKLFNGDTTTMEKLTMEAWSQPMSLNHSIVQRMNPFLHQMVETYGKICVCWVGTKPRLIISKAEVMRMVLNDKDGNFQKPPQNPLVDLLTRGVSTLEGEKWGKRRGLIIPAFHYEKVQGMMTEFVESCCNFIDRWRKLVSDGPIEIDMKPEVQNLSSDVIARTAFGSSYEEGKEIFELQKEQALLVNEAFQAMYIPGLRFLPTKKNRKRYEVDAEIKLKLRDIIRKKEMAVRKGESSSVDLLGLLLQCKENEANDLTVEDIIEECKLFYIVGQETTANWLTWTLILLSMHQEWQEKARQEVLQVCGNTTPDIHTLNRLKIVTMVLHEVLRLYPPVSHLFRYTSQKTEIGGLEIPKDVEIFLPITQLHHDSEYWADEAEEFKPERFAEGVSRASNGAYFPFGWGPRICLGQAFAVTEAKLAMAMILQNFTFKLSPSYTHAPHTIITLQPQHGAPIILERI